MKTLQNGTKIEDIVKDLSGIMLTLKEMREDLSQEAAHEPATEGTLPDGTPIADMLDEMRDLKMRITEMKNLAREIASKMVPGVPMTAAWRTSTYELAKKIGKV